MLCYVKSRLYNKANGTFAGNGLIVKCCPDEQHRADFYFVCKDGTFPSLASNIGSLGVELGGVRFEVEHGDVSFFKIASGLPVDSFETIVIGERARSDSKFYNFTIVLGDEVFTPSDVFSVNLDDVFLQETRQDAAVSGVLIKGAYTQTETYTGFSSYHYNQRVHTFNLPLNNDKDYRIGVELELYARSQEAYNKIINARTNWFQCESDGSLREYSYPIEMKTIPLRPVDATSVDFWNEPMRKLKELAFSSKFKRTPMDEGRTVTSTGLHVHISKEILGRTEQERQKNLDKLMWFYTYYIEEVPENHALNVKICGREKGYGVTDGGPRTELGDFAKLIGLTEVAKCNEAYQRVVSGMKTKLAEQRGDINIKRWDTYGTIEFRKGKGTIGGIRLAAICTWWEQMCLYCKETAPQNLSFEDFFTKVNRFPCVAHYFQPVEEEA